MALILDTNALSAFAEGDAGLKNVIGAEADIAVPSVVLGEYFFGIRQSRHWSQYDRWLRTHLPIFVVLPVGTATAGYYAEIRAELKSAGRPIPSNDLWIAALSREHGYGIVTRDRHFEAVRGLNLHSW